MATQVTKIMHKRTFGDAEKMAASMRGSADTTDAIKEELDAALASHPGNPANGGKAAANGNGGSTDGKAERASKADRRNAILARWKKDEIDDATKDKELDALDHGGEMAVEIRDGKLCIEIEMQEPTASASGKTLVVASSRGNAVTTAMVNGKAVIVGLNAYIRP